MTLADVFRGRKALVFGGLGFLGSNLAHVLVRFGARVTVVDALLPQYGGNCFNLHGIEDQVRVIVGDIRDEHLVQEIVVGQDYVFNFAAQVSYIDSAADPLLDLDINCRGHLVVLEACRRMAPEALVLFSSSRLVYGRIQQVPVTETHPTEPLGFYGIHKLTAEKYYLLYHHSYGLRTAIVRIPNPYGPRQQMKHSRYSLPGWFVRQAMEGRTITVYGEGNQRRDYIYVDDIVDAFVRVASCEGVGGEVFNVGSVEPVRFVDMVDTVLAVVNNGRKEHVPWPANYEANETGDYVADTSKLFKMTGWQPTVQLSEGITRTFYYYRRHKEHYWQ